MSQITHNNLPTVSKKMDNLAQKKQEKDELFIAASKFKVLTGRYPTDEINMLVEHMKRNQR